MSNRPAATEAESAADHAAEDSLFHREVLNELIGLGSDLARMIHGQAKDQAAARYADEGVPDVTVAFERVCQTVRRTILLCRKIAEPVPTRAAVQAAARRAAVRREVARAVEASIAEQATDGDAAGLRCELGERMERLEAEDADLERPVGEIILEIRRALGLCREGLLDAGGGSLRTPAEMEMEPPPAPPWREPLAGADAAGAAERPPRLWRPR
jgi:hypothetical protein